MIRKVVITTLIVAAAACVWCQTVGVPVELQWNLYETARAWFVVRLTDQGLVGDWWRPNPHAWGVATELTRRGFRLDAEISPDEQLLDDEIGFVATRYPLFWGLTQNVAVSRAVLPFWLPTVLLLAWPAIAFVRGPVRRRERRLRGDCAACGNDLGGVTTPSCLACGTGFDPEEVRRHRERWKQAEQRAVSWFAAYRRSWVRWFGLAALLLGVPLCLAVWVASYARITYTTPAWQCRLAWGNVILDRTSGDERTLGADSAAGGRWASDGFHGLSTIWWPYPFFRREPGTVLHLPLWIPTLACVVGWARSARPLYLLRWARSLHSRPLSMRRVLKWSGLAMSLVIVSLIIVSRYWVILWDYGSWEGGFGSGGMFVGLGSWSPEANLDWMANGVFRPALSLYWGVDWRSDLGSEIGVFVPLWIPLVLVMLTTALIWRSDRRPRAGHCERCGYNLTGNVSGICSECGTRIALDGPATSSA